LAKKFVAVAADIDALVANKFVAVAEVTVATPRTAPCELSLVIVDDAIVAVASVAVPGTLSA